ncbi:30S ribosomal protein S6 [Candidatus Shapirobacteria bacterium CG10_big_fil_rev_8_21_14_0_10_38_14]|uniref:Small ribosomal subunit protein bS6 n=1 Tax=Candidatus Shapirobacteria bacterium CG10_big_fil_rev_8_21_14_0_10_38_14 TaxID=1974483 RepID=A0A2M8L509_9BACT|nr:MAG: 30S ribosomal protein S6 [Candidatus Shapirobacteria bacterium CG10_big_fil_rev_8_21_14_0_10_38_14]
MRDYEFTFIVDSDLGAEEKKELTAKIQKIVTDCKGKVEKQDEWGKKELAYPIKKKNMGVYFFWFLKLPPESASQMDQKLKREEEIIRYLLVKKEALRQTQGKEVNKNGAKVAK